MFASCSECTCPLSSTLPSDTAVTPSTRSVARDRIQLLCVARGVARECHRALFCRNADRRRVDSGFPAQLVDYGVLQFPVGFHSNFYPPEDQLHDLVLSAGLDLVRFGGCAYSDAVCLLAVGLHSLGGSLHGDFQESVLVLRLNRLVVDAFQ